jgi:hypothetical protein
MGVLESTILDLREFKSKLSELKIKPEALNPQSIKDAGKLAGEIAAEVPKASLISPMDIAELLNSDSPNVSPGLPAQPQPGSAPGPMSAPVQPQPASAPVQPQPGPFTNETPRQRAEAIWSAINEDRPEYILENGVVKVHIDPSTRFFKPNSLEPNTSPSALKATKGVYDALLDH